MIKLTVIEGGNEKVHMIPDCERNRTERELEKDAYAYIQNIILPVIRGERKPHFDEHEGYIKTMRVYDLFLSKRPNTIETRKLIWKSWAGIKRIQMDEAKKELG